jgi:hypothetical protein
LSTFPAEVGTEAENWLNGKNVHLIFNTTYNPAINKDYDMVITTTG